jgi:hypothetical protein
MRRRVWLWSLLTIVSGTAAVMADDTPRNSEPPVSVRTSGAWSIAESRNFRCWACDRVDARKLALACEELRTRLRELWGVEDLERNWTPRCEVFVHGTQAAYCSALARPGDASVGSTQIQFDGERAVFRRIDLRADAADWTGSALPHELTHVVLAERFRGRPLPPWADEGIAMLSESDAKRATRIADLQRARETYSIRELTAVRQLPPPHRRDAFYSQSLVLTSWLVEQSSPRQFARFLEACDETSFDVALHSQLGWAGTEALEASWHARSRTPKSVELVDLWEHNPTTDFALD